ncbi:hypothetical protein [Brumimicrobium aurantiacum]|uniref:Uncharacterized protein n=1 Tax=Brumimicrobium aurantiacum TaxID=1737063 RepID=A0A3E1F266_9FLAO|nr:hypothetical protein [Brumimicrobium aurantiacum]RFC55797.1 hypothetical protein DXU93_02350 [Brumimicrobium aurantiacum]
MKTGIANKKIEKIIALVEKEGVLAESLVQELTELRELALKEEDPLLAKVTRLSFEYLTENEAYDVQALWEEDEEGGEFPLEIDDKENLLNLLNLMLKSDHKINREEIKDYRTALKEELY